VFANFNGIFIGSGEFFQFSARDDVYMIYIQRIPVCKSPHYPTSPWSTLFFHVVSKKDPWFAHLDADLKRGSNWLIIYGFTPRSIHVIVHLTGEGLQSLGICSTLGAFEQGRIFIVPHLLWLFRSYPKDRPIQSPLTTHQGVWKIYSNPNPHGRRSNHYMLI
jgi:hypothetical protein